MTGCVCFYGKLHGIYFQLLPESIPSYLFQIDNQNVLFAKLHMTLFTIYFSTAFLHGLFGDIPFGLWIPQLLISTLWQIGYNILSLQVFL
jgi:hypothetical protein